MKLNASSRFVSNPNSCFSFLCAACSSSSPFRGWLQQGLVQRLRKWCLAFARSWSRTSPLELKTNIENALWSLPPWLCALIFSSYPMGRSFSSTRITVSVMVVLVPSISTEECHVFTGECTGAALSFLWNYGLSFLLSVFHDLPSYVLQYYGSRSCFLDSDVASLLPGRLGQSSFLRSLGRISEGHGGLPHFLRAGLFDCSRDGKPAS